MTDREKAIKTLEDIIATAECIKGLSEDAGITISLDKIDSLRFALESIKVDRAYDLAYEKVDFIEIPEGATKLDMVKLLFPRAQVWESQNKVFIGRQYLGYPFITIDKHWGNHPYRKE